MKQNKFKTRLIRIFKICYYAEQGSIEMSMNFFGKKISAFEFYFTIFFQKFIEIFQIGRSELQNGFDF